MRRDRKNVLVLAICQMLLGTGRSLLIATAPLIALGIAEDKALATLPQSLVLVGTAAATLPASFLMRRIGRRAGFIIGTLIGGCGGVVDIVAIVHADFWLFSLGTLMFGFLSGFGQLYRFAAADVAAADYKAKAISLVLAGGVVAGFVGPELAKIGKNLIASVEFVGGYAILTTAILLSSLVLLFLDIPPMSRAERSDTGRPLREIITQPVVIASVTTALIAQGVMNFLMTATPIAMEHVHHLFADTATVIEWHLIGMFAPGFFTGHLVRRFGDLKILLTGLLLELICIGVALSGVSVFNFWLAMFLLGLGWNFAYTASTSIVTTAYTPAERAKTEGAMNFLIYGVVSVLSLSSGVTIHYFGWTWVNLGALPLLAVALVAAMWYAGYARRALAVAEQA
jgi:MFS family permease